MASNITEVSLLVEGGKASGGPPLGPAIGPTGVPVNKIVDEINEKTKGYKGLKVPVTVFVNTDDKTFTIALDTPMTSALLIKEVGADKGSSEPTTDLIGDLSMEQIMKIADMKTESLNSLTMRTRVKSVVGTAYSCGITIDGKQAGQVTKEINEGKYDSQLGEA